MSSFGGEEKLTAMTMEQVDIVTRYRHRMENM